MTLALQAFDEEHQTRSGRTKYYYDGEDYYRTLDSVAWDMGTNEFGLSGWQGFPGGPPDGWYDAFRESFFLDFGFSFEFTVPPFDPGPLFVPSQGTQPQNETGSLWDAIREGGSAEAGIGAGYHLKDLKIGPLKAGGGVVFGSGGVGADSEGWFVWGESTLDVQLSAGRYGGRAYLWDVDIGSRGVDNIDVLGVESPTWDWSVGVGGTWTPYSFEFDFDFQPLIDYFRRE